MSGLAIGDKVVLAGSLPADLSEAEQNRVRENFGDGTFDVWAIENDSQKRIALSFRDDETLFVFVSCDELWVPAGEIDEKRCWKNSGSTCLVRSDLFQKV